MGLGFLVVGKVNGRGLLRRPPSRERLFADICDAVRGQTNEHLLEQMIQTHVSQHTLSVELHPCAEPLEFEWRPDRTLQASAKTSTLGPGYHSYVIDLLCRIGQAIDVQWDWAPSDADETGFVRSRDFGGLQGEMAILLRALGRNLTKLAAEDHDNLMLSMPIGFPLPKGNAFVVSPTGPLSAEWCRGLAEADDATMDQFCRSFYIWWHQKPDAEFWRKTGLYLMWCEVPWHVPINEGERRMCQLAIDSLEMARHLDSATSLPEFELSELQQLVAGVGEGVPPQQQGVGYYRLPMARRGTGDWTVVVPGYYYEQLEEEGSQVVWWFGGRTVRLSSLTVGDKPGSRAAGRNILPEKTRERVEGYEVIDHDRGHIAGWAAIGPAEQDGDKFWQLQGTMACGNSLCIVTVCYVNREDKDWAIDVFRSVTHPEPNGHDEQ